MSSGTVQERIAYDRVVALADDGEPKGVRGRPLRRRCCSLSGPRFQMAMFVAAQPITFLLWSWALHRALPSVQGVFDSHGYAFNIVLFYLVLSVLVVVLFPLGVVDLAAGFLFGVWVGFPVALAAKTSGSVLCFLLSRHTCSEYIRNTLVENYEWLTALGLMMKKQQFRTMALLRFSVIPAALKNYGCGSLSVSLWVYATVTAMALSVESFLLVPVGAKIDSLEGMLTRKETIQEKAALILGLILLVALCLAIRHTVRLQIEQIQRDTARGARPRVEREPLASGVNDIEMRAEDSVMRMMEHQIL